MVARYSLSDILVMARHVIAVRLTSIEINNDAVRCTRSGMPAVSAGISYSFKESRGVESRREDSRERGPERVEGHAFIPHRVEVSPGDVAVWPNE